MMIIYSIRDRANWLIILIVFH